MGRTEKREMTIPVDRPQQLLIRSKYVEPTRSKAILLILNVIDPTQLSFSVEFFPNPKPLIAKTLYGLKDFVVKQLGEVPLCRW